MSEDIYGADYFCKDFLALIEELEQHTTPKNNDDSIRNISLVLYPEIKEDKSYYIYKLEKLLLRLIKEKNDSRKSAFVYDMKATKEGLCCLEEIIRSGVAPDDED